MATVISKQSPPRAAVLAQRTQTVEFQVSPPTRSVLAWSRTAAPPWWTTVIEMMTRSPQRTVVLAAAVVDRVQQLGPPLLLVLACGAWRT
jgi:hypothetical protein